MVPLSSFPLPPAGEARRGLASNGTIIFTKIFIWKAIAYLTLRASKAGAIADANNPMLKCSKTLREFSVFHFNRLRHHKTTLFLSGLIILSLFIKLFIFLFFFHGNAEQITQPDSNSYLAPAQSLLSQHSFYEMFERTPGYPLFIAGLFWDRKSVV